MLARLVPQERIIAHPSLCIRALAGRASLGGPFVRTTERAVQNATRDVAAAAAELELVISVGGGDGWVPSVGDDHPSTTALLAALRSSQAEPYGWNAVVLPALGHAHVSAPSEGNVSIRLPWLCDGCDGYAISEPETLQLTIPAEAVLSNSAIPLATEVVITATAGILELGGSLVRPH
jgi:hypothetical protein